MDQELHIARPPNDTQITLQEWVSALRFVKGVRLAGRKWKSRDPVAGEGTIVIYGGHIAEAGVDVFYAGHDAEVYFQEEGVWRRAFSWSRSGRITFRPTLGFDNAMNPLRRAAFALSAILSAEIRGDEGELYEH